MRIGMVVATAALFVVGCGGSTGSSGGDAGGSSGGESGSSASSSGGSSSGSGNSSSSGGSSSGSGYISSSGSGGSSSGPLSSGSSSGSGYISSSGGSNSGGPSSSSGGGSGGGSCTEPSGTYTIAWTLVSGGELCALYQADFGKTTTFGGDAGTVDVDSGSACSPTINGCSFSVNCPISLGDAGAGQVSESGTVQSDGTITGTVTISVDEAALMVSCTFNFTDTPQ
jgi:hypothetical protein